MPRDLTVPGSNPGGPTKDLYPFGFESGFRNSKKASPTNGCAALDITKLLTAVYVLCPAFSIDFNHVAPPQFKHMTPYAIGIVEMPEGVRLPSIIRVSRLESFEGGNGAGSWLQP